jgi:hypothetical protein
MRRATLSEIHEQAWFPGFLRNLVTDALQSALIFGRVYHPVAPQLARAIDASGSVRVVDLCSGAGGPWEALHPLLESRVRSPLEICLTDKYPNLGAFDRIRQISRGAIIHSADPVDAAAIPPSLSGFRTIFSSFHHFTPDEAVAILQGAVDQRQGIGIFEGAQRRPRTVITILAMPLAALLTAPAIQPFRWSRLFWTYLVPVIPFVLLWDGWLSCLRAYSPDEYRQLISRLDAPGYTWTIGEARGGFAPVMCVVGYPSTPVARAVVDRPAARASAAS